MFNSLFAVVYVFRLTHIEYKKIYLFNINTKNQNFTFSESLKNVFQFVYFVIRFYNKIPVQSCMYKRANSVHTLPHDADAMQ